jgi:prepilin-type N-terminal cleavage/methylation domain-containing protein
MNRRRRLGFTLIELLVVIAIIAGLSPLSPTA